MADAAHRPRSAHSEPFARKWSTIGLVCLLLLAVALRLPALTDSPPGLHQDEAANAWNAWCLIHTGMDQNGAPWPVFYFRALGENRTPLFLYFLMPFQLIGGLNVHTTRLPNVVGGVICVALIYYIGSKWFGRGPGLIAAALLAVSPWAVHQSRWGHEGGSVLLLTLVPLAAWIWAGLPFQPVPTRELHAHDPNRPGSGTAKLSRLRCLLAGLVSGLACYGYPSVRIFVPVLLAAMIVVTLPQWLALLRCGRAQGLSLIAFLIGFLALFGPLAFVHFTSEEINKRARFSWVWEENDTAQTRIGKVLSRYPGHFGPDFLFLHGDRHPLTRSSAGGQMGWYTLPGLLIGVPLLLWRIRREPCAILLLVWVLVYPVGDLLNTHRVSGVESMHTMRSMPGAAALSMVASYGAWAALTAVRRIPMLPILLIVCWATAITVETCRITHRMLTIDPKSPAVWAGFHADLLQACEWIRPRLDDYEFVFCTTTGFNQAPVISLVGLEYSPKRWFEESRSVHEGPQWDVYLRFGRFHFLYPTVWDEHIRSLQRDGVQQRALLILRPGESTLREPVLTIIDPTGRPTLLLFEIDL